jgi:hypothetical protein
MRALLSEHGVQLWLTLGFAAVMTLLGARAGWPGPVGFTFYLGVVLYLAPFALLPAALVLVWRYRHRYHTSRSGLPAHRAWPRAARDFVRGHLTANRLVGFLLVVILTSLVMAIFGGWKQTFPQVVPFRWDPTLMRVDRWLHGGHLPHEWLAPILARPNLARAWDRLYIVSWFGVVALAWILAAAAPFSPLRRRFWVANTLTWIILGVVAATAFSSAGPWAYGAVVCDCGPRAACLCDPYAPLMAQLRDLHASGSVKALLAQRVLWDAHTAEPQRVLVGAGISAMPSLHIAMVSLVAIASWSIARWLGVLATLYAGAMLVGSVLSGMHYAIDGYVSIALVIALWWIAGRLARNQGNPHVSYSSDP